MAKITKEKSQAEKLAIEFMHRIRLYLTKEEFKELVARTKANADKRICFSHDYCDANMVMNEAFGQIFGRDIDATKQADLDMCSKAWEITRVKNFTERNGAFIRYAELNASKAYSEMSEGERIACRVDWLNGSGNGGVRNE